MLRIIAPFVISTLYNGLWSDSHSSYFTQSYTYAPLEYQFSCLLDLIFFFYAKQLTPCLAFPSEETSKHAASFVSDINTLECEASFTLPCFAVTWTVFVTACCIWEYSCCEPRCEELRHLVTHTTTLLVTLLAKTHTLYALCCQIHYC
jgi:hypothetical protein